jgi:hypothetical protein
MKHNLFIFGILFLLLGCSKPQNNISTKVEIIEFDSKKSIEKFKFDMKDILDTTMLIVPLETNENCLIASIDMIEMRNERIYVVCQLSKAVYIFDMEGKYQGKIDAIGQGPGEYSNVSYMTVTDTSIIIIDHFRNKQIEYAIPSLRFIKEENIFSKIWATNVFTLPEYIYYINDWSNSKLGKFRLFSRKNGKSDFDNYLPFEDEPSNACAGINLAYAINGNAASIIYSGDNVIYRLEEDKIFPKYEVNFKDKKVVNPSGIVVNIENENPDGRVYGITSINESDKYLFFDTQFTGTNNYSCLYDKINKTTIVYNLAINSTFDNFDVHIRRIIGDKLIDWLEADILSTMIKENYENKTFKNKSFENRFKNLFANLKGDNNPVLFIYNFK